ncbi:MAG: hypothetical protein NZL94_03995 [Meiothermus sp.]|nr:hypothetical protein [Meiothermus sp.]
MRGKLLVLRVDPKAHPPLAVREAGGEVRHFASWEALLAYLEAQYPLARGGERPCKDRRGLF